MANSIALVGAPGSGKTELANDIVETEQFQDHVVIDNYAQTTSTYTNLALGPYATYVGNYLVAADRLRREVRAIKHNEDHIVCGTLIETAVYMSMRGGLDNVGGSSEANRIAAFMQMLGMLFNDVGGYDKIFYLPLVDGSEINKRVDSEIVDALGVFGVPYITLGEDRVQEVLDAFSEPASTEIE